ncbi:unnamed protein product [Dracunculus medinensis]|uniref:Ground-like domain-containing protein n=1 Tax=Dracunculus medinensis TaxID=318479 RepID=A0A158Q5X7_DRAME|nr:unnamed protein product [Dracunculus medinensis]
MCCNKTLEEMMHQSYQELRNERNWQSKLCICDSHRIATHAEKFFNHSFETVVSGGDFAAKVHYHSSFLCKIEMHGTYMLAYGTPLWI